jgi:hypothetical protein
MKKSLCILVFLITAALPVPAILFSCLAMLCSKLSGGFDWLSCMLEEIPGAVDEWKGSWSNNTQK